MNEALVILATIASTLDECKEAPESSLWLPFMGKLQLADFQRILGVLVTMRLCKIKDHLVIFTEPEVGSQGEKFMAGVREIYAKHR